MTFQINSSKKFIAAAATTALVVTAVAPTAGAASSFTDVSERYKEAVDYLVDQKITEGFTKTRYGTEMNITRVDASILLTKALGLDLSNVKDAGFTDVPKRGQVHVSALKELGIANGKTATHYAASQNVTRGEIAIMLYRAYDIGTATDGTKFTDVPERYQEAVNALLLSGITSGKTDTSFGTNDAITRGEFAIFLHRISAFDKNTDIPDGENPDGENPDGENPDGDAVDKSGLQDLIDGVGDLVEDYYTTDSWKDLQDALNKAEDVVADKDATQGDVDKAIKDLENAIKDLVLKQIPYTVDTKGSPSTVVFTFTKSVGVDGAITPVSGTIANATAKLEDKGVTLTLSSPTGAQNGETAKFDLNVGGTKVAVTLTLKGNAWEITTVPADVFIPFKNGGGSLDPNADIGSLIDLDVLNKGLLDGSISLEDLLNNPNLLRLKLLPGSGLAVGDVINLGLPGGLSLLNITLTQNDLDNGFVDLGIKTDLLKQLGNLGQLGKALDLTATVERAGTVVRGLVGGLNLPLLPLVDPVLDLTQTTVEDLMYILSGDKALKIGLKADGLEQLAPGNVLKLTLQGKTTETVEYIISKADIDRGYVEYKFSDTGLIQRLLTGLTTGSKIKITPEITDGEQTNKGQTIEIEVSQGLLNGITTLLKEILGGGLLGGVSPHPPKSPVRSTPSRAMPRATPTPSHSMPP